jgi:hypothetical protein
VVKAFLGCMPKVEIIGVYPADVAGSIYLVELSVRGAVGVFHSGEFTQEISGQPRSNWQAPYMEQVLNADSTKVVADDSEARRTPELFSGDARFVFFFHFLDLQRPFCTLFGEMNLPDKSEFPRRLSMIHYEEP